ncbi:hypothetical protein AUP74_03270 [Microbulbifer aggregans]|uniref:Uncharacterized protein n=1 Tax=Microbulbifer aggregans TaxID=1769779 RepID=A0A1C9WBV7_9GAMM|nr:hypothetical protein [Microbulbifer aggregans]AOS98636.1 hypothetical protein AUP74_03270 [Microbulbifer aggregans]
MKGLENHKKITILVDADNALRKPLLEPAIGVIYRLETEPRSHNLYVHIRAQCDVTAHRDENTTFQPLDLTEGWDQQEPTETLPFSI